MSSRISASQIDTYEGCNRFWWMQRILKLTEPPQAHFTFGTVTHAVNERYLSADKNQRVPHPEPEDAKGAGMQRVWNKGPLVDQVGGRPVNLYPKGWETVQERDGSEASVTPTEARLIRKLVTESIDNGVLRWRAGTQVERELLLTVIKGVQLIGYVDAYKGPTDVQLLPVIEDHKTYGKGSLRFLKRANVDSPNYIGKNQQLLTYCWAISVLDSWEGDVIVRHNQYPKFPGKEVTAVEGTITRAEIVAHGEYLEEVAGRMELTRNIKDWADVPGPKDTGLCSRRFGKPCAFSDICGRAETPDAYLARLERLKSGSFVARLNLPLATPKKRTQGNETMSIFDRANKQKAKRAARKEAAGTTEAKAVVDATPAVNGAEPAPVATPAVGGAPWANPSCKACKGRGLTSKNKSCPICDLTAKKGKRPTSMMYVVEITEEGMGVAVAREENVPDLVDAGCPLEWIEEEALESAPAATEPAVATTPAPVEKAPEAAVEPAVEPAKPARRKRRTKAEMAAARVEAAEAKAAESIEVDAEAIEGTPAVSAIVEVAPVVAKTKAGRPSVGLTIMVGAMYLTGQPGGRTVITSSEALNRFGAELAADMGAATYWELDSFKRRERLAQKADYIASQLARHILVHPGILGNDDEGKLVQALMGLSEGIEGVITRIG